MAEIQPFSAIRYDFSKLNGDVSTRIAPPYDVLDQADKDRLLAQDDRNIVEIDLPFIPPKKRGPDEAYAKAAETMQAWLADGTLVREEEPALYIYHQTFTHEGKQYTRRKFFARIRLVEFSEGIVLPHEETFGGPKEDRLALMHATKSNLSPVFGLYTDPTDEIGKAFSARTSQTPDAQGMLEGVENRLWIERDPAVIAKVQQVLADKNIYIADGHHRYGTAINYRNEIIGANGGSIPSDHPANFALMVFACMDDEGCQILPYPRAFADITMDAVLEAWKPGTEEVGLGEADLALNDGQGRLVGLRFTKRDILNELAPGYSEAWRKLDLAYLHRYLIDELMTKGATGEPKIRYLKSNEMACQTALKESGVAVLPKATPMEHLRGVSDAGDKMPQKSTYFAPKLATGFTINPLA